MKNKTVFLSLLLFFVASCGNTNAPSNSNNSINSNNSNDVSSTITSEAQSSSESIKESISSSIESNDLSSSESTTQEKKVWPNDEAINASVEVSSIADVIDACYALPIKDNGSTYSTNAANNKRTFDFYKGVEPTKVKFIGQYIDKSEDKNPVFYDGKDVIQVYCIDDNKVENLLDTDSALGNTYEVTGYATMYKNKPSILIIKTYEEELKTCSFVLKEKATTANTPSLNRENIINTTVADLMKTSPSYLTSKEKYRNIYHYEGYLGSYSYGNNEYLMMVDNLTDNCNPFSTSTFKAVKINDYDELSYGYLYECLNNKEKVSFDFYIFQWLNVNKKSIYEIEVISSTLM